MEDHELLFVNKLISELFQARQIIKNMQQQEVLNKPKSSKK
jgi:hypothetical protein